MLSVVDERNVSLEQNVPAPPRVARPESTFLVVNMMRSVINNGTAAAARTMGFTADAAGKTGTTNDLRDAWFAGFTADLLCVVWVGFDDNTPIGLSGAKAALPIWVDFMKGALAGTKGVSAPDARPPTSSSWRSTRRPACWRRPYCPATIDESFIAGTEPQEICSWHSGASDPYDPAYPAPSPSPWR